MVTITLDAVKVRLGERDVVEDITATLAPGSLIGVIGPNGAGKSTLVRAIMGLQPLAGGAIRIDGEPVDRIPRNHLARRLAYLPQGQELHWPLSVERLVALGRLPHLAPFSRLTATDSMAIEAAMRRADVGHLRYRNALELSGGERARALLARALAVGANALVVDEPLTSLDPGHQIDVMDLLAREARHGGLVVAVLHDLAMAARYCDRLLLVDRGRMVADDAPAKVLTAEHLAGTYGIRAFIGTEGTSPLVVPLARAPRRPA